MEKRPSKGYGLQVMYVTNLVPEKTRLSGQKPYLNANESEGGEGGERRKRKEKKRKKELGGIDYKAE